MSSYLTAPTSTMPSSSNSSSQPDRALRSEDHPTSTALDDRETRVGPEDRQANTVAIIACGALGAHVREISRRRGWQVRLHCLPPIWHNSPRLIAPAAERLASQLLRQGLRVVLAYADCGTYGELDEVCARLGIARLAGLHCYDAFAGPERIRAELADEPGTYLLTDYLVRSFRSSVLDSLGLDRHPELWQDYFGHYRRLVWLRQSAEAGLVAEAESVAAMFGLPLTVVDVGTSRLERELESLVGAAVAPAVAPAASAAALAISAKDPGGYRPPDPSRSSDELERDATGASAITLATEALQ